MKLVFRGTLRDVLRAALLAAGTAAVAACSGPPPPDADYPGGPIRGFGHVPVAASAAALTERPSSPIRPTPIRPIPDAAVAPAVAAPVERPRWIAPDLVAALDPLTVDPAVPMVAPINDDPGRLLGLDQGALRTLLGNPRFVRRDDPARMWRYRHASCVLDLFLYAEPGDAAKSFKVRHVEARAPGAKAASTRSCLRALLSDRRPGSTG